MRQKGRRWRILWFPVFIFQLVYAAADGEDVTQNNRHSQKSPFSPRMDYNQWKPLGRGDPLKNDPTFDYVPPVLDQVHYWMDPETRPSDTRTSNYENRQKTEILLLGVSSKKPATYNSGQQITADSRRDTIYEPHQKYHQEKSPSNYYHFQNQRIARPNYFPSMPSSIIPSLMSLANHVLDRTIYSKGQESKTPYTVLMPPPMATKNPQGIGSFTNVEITPSITHKLELFTTPRPLSTNMMLLSTSPSSNGVSVQESNLIYHSSSLGNQNEFGTNQDPLPSISWELTSTTQIPPQHKVMFKQSLTPPKSFIRIQFSPQNNHSHNILEASDSKQHENYVTPPPLNDNAMMFKGQVSDDNDITNSYVKIEKPQAQVDHMGVKISNVHPVPVMYPHAEPFRLQNNIKPLDLQLIQDMETMKPPPVTKSPVFNRPTNAVTSVLKKEQVRPNFDITNYVGSSSSVSSTIVTSPKVVVASSSMPSLAESTSNPTTILTNSGETTTLMEDLIDTPTTTESSTTLQTLTTDSLFRHYKQPVEPLRGPLYLIIQGHSKVKTYKPAKQIDGIMIQETNEIPYLSKDLGYSVKHLHGFNIKKDILGDVEEIARNRHARTGNLQTLKHVVQTGLGAIDFETEQEIRRRSDIDFQETDVENGYEVVDSKDVTSEKYHRGIVEEARRLKFSENVM